MGVPPRDNMPLLLEVTAARAPDRFAGSTISSSGAVMAGLVSVSGLQTVMVARALSAPGWWLGMRLCGWCSGASYAVHGLKWCIARPDPRIDGVKIPVTLASARLVWPVLRLNAVVTAFDFR